MPNVFDDLASKQKKSNIFEQLAQKKIEIIKPEEPKSDIFERLKKEVPDLIRKYIKANQPKIQRPLQVSDILQLIKNELKKLPEPKPQEKVIVEKTVEKVEVPQEELNRLNKQIEEIKSLFEKEIEDKIKSLKQELSDSFSGFVPRYLPKPAGNVGKILSSDGHKWKWVNYNDPESSQVIYIGDQTTNGSWRIIISGNDLNMERLESGSWVPKGGFEP